MEQEQIIIPKGWTYFAHRTNTSKWSDNPFNKDIIKTTKLMSVVTESEVYQELRHYGYKHSQIFSMGGGEPFEIRCLICDLSYLNNLENNPIKKIMWSEFYYDRNNFGGAYGQRHHSIPNNEELIVIGIGNKDEVFLTDKKIIWTIPKRFLEFYKEEVKKGKNRTIPIENKDNYLNNPLQHI